jgi:hypothetical protein
VSTASQPATVSTSSISFEAEIIKQLKDRLQFAELKIQLLEERLRQMLI